MDGWYLAGRRQLAWCVAVQVRRLHGEPGKVSLVRLHDAQSYYRLCSMPVSHNCFEALCGWSSGCPWSIHRAVQVLT